MAEKEVATIVPIKFDENNHNRWAMAMKRFLVRKELWHLVDGFTLELQLILSINVNGMEEALKDGERDNAMSDYQKALRD
jgi:hypothetical protein